MIAAQEDTKLINNFLKKHPNFNTVECAYYDFPTNNKSWRLVASGAAQRIESLFDRGYFIQTELGLTPCYADKSMGLLSNWWSTTKEIL
jgi:hypothetical protein